MRLEAIIHIRFTHYWAAGTGAAGGRYADVVTYLDRSGCPAIRMSQVKGQLRETAERLAAGGCAGWTTAHVNSLFGHRTQQGDPAPPKKADGALAFPGEARLPPALIAQLSPADKKALIRRLSATRINDRGVADDKTLRTLEVAVPVAVSGRVSWISPEPVLANWLDLLDAACAATVSFGKLKTDGFGRAIASLERV